MNLIKNRVPDSIESKNIILKKIDVLDAKELFNLIYDMEVVKFLNIALPSSVKDEEIFIKNLRKRWNNGVEFAYSIYIKSGSELCKNIKKNNDSTKQINSSICGMASVWNLDYIHKNGEIGIWLGKDFWGFEINYEVIQLLMNISFERIKLVRLEARMCEENIRSIKTFEKLNFQREGLLRKKANIRGNFHNLFIYSILRDEYKI